MTQNEWNNYLTSRLSADTAVGLSDSIEIAQKDLLAKKIEKLQVKTLDKAERLGIGRGLDSDTYNSPILGTTNGKAWYDADSPYNNILPDNSQNTMRLGNTDSSTSMYVNTPEKKFKDREATPEEKAAYFASMVAKDNFAMGTTPATKEEFQDLIQNPLTPENEALYTNAMNEAYATIGNTIDLRGIEGKVGKHGRQVVQAYNPTAPDPTESLQDRLLKTGNAQMFSYGKPIQEELITTSGTNDQSLSEYISQLAKESPNEGGLGNAVAGFGYMLGEGIASTLDLVPEVAQYAYGNLVGDGKTWADSKGLYDEKEAKQFKEWTGYNDEILNRLGQEAAVAAKDAVENGNYWGLAEVVGKAIMTPELAGTSLGFVGGMILPGTAGKRVVDVATGVNKAAKAMMAADTTGKLTKAEAMVQAGNDAGVGYKIASVLAGNTGYVAAAEGFARDAEALYQETYKEEMPTAQRIALRPIGLLWAKMDAGIAKALVLGKDPVAKAVPELIKALPDQMKATLIGKVAVMSGVTAARAAGAFGLEALTEGVQTAMEQIAGKYKEGTADVGDVLDESKYDIAGGALLGGAGGTQFAAPTTIKDVAKEISPSAIIDYAKTGVEKMTETPEQKVMRENFEYSAPLKAEAETALATGAADEVVSRVEAIHGRVSKDLDESAPKEFTYGIVIRNALNKANADGDAEAVKNIYKTIGELDAREDVDFKASSVISDRTYEATKAFIKMVNESTETASDKMDILKAGKASADEAADTVVKTGTKIDANILAKVAALKASIEQEQAAMKDVMGSDSYEEDIKASQELVKLMTDYMNGKDLDTVNAELSTLGYLQLDPTSGEIKADPSRPGLVSYAKELTADLLNPKANANLLDKKVTAGKSVTLTGLQGFANSRLTKLFKGKEGTAYQTNKMINSLLPENEEMIAVIKGLQETNNGLKGLKAETKAKYTTLLEDALNKAQEANEVLIRRQKALESAGKPTEKGQYAFQIDNKGNETIQLVNYDENRKAVKVEVAKVNEDGTLEWTNGEPTVAKPVEAKATPDEVVYKEDYQAKAKFKEDKTVETAKPVEPELEQNKPTGLNLSNPSEEVVKFNKLVNDAIDTPSASSILATKEESIKEASIVLSKLEEGLNSIDNSDYTEKAKKDIKEKLTKRILETKEHISELAAGKYHTETNAVPEYKPNKEDYHNAAKFAKEPEPEVKPKAKVNSLQQVRDTIAKLDAELAAELEGVQDMDMKAHVKAHYKKKLAEIQAERGKLDKMMDIVELAVDKKLNENAAKKVSAVLAFASKIVKDLLDRLAQLRTKLRLNREQHKAITAEMNNLLDAITEVEKEYLETNKIAPVDVKTAIGKVTKYEDSVYGPMVEIGDKRVAANKKLKSGKPDMYNAMEVLKAEKIAELDAEIAETGSLGARLLKRNLERYGLGTVINRILERSRDSIFGKMNADMFANPEELIANLPKGFKDVFMSDGEDKDLLIEHFATMDKYLKSVKVGDIKMNPKASITGKTQGKSHIDINGLIMKNVVKESDGTIHNFPVDIIELIGTVKDGKLELDEQTETILKFYTAKMAVDTQAMIGNILSMDETEMGKYLGITDPVEQLQVKQDAAKGFINSATVRKDIGSEVYRALGLRFDNKTPEFTEESFESALGVLVQAIALDSGVMNGDKSARGNKHQNLIQVNKKVVESDKVLGDKGYEKLIKAMNKLQYLNESRNRPLPTFKQPEPKASGERLVMNTRIAIDDETNKKMNKTEQIGYKISDRLAKYLKMDEAKVLKAMGYVEIEGSGLHVSEHAAQLARNDKLIREWDILKVFAKSAKDRMFYIPWGQTVSGRYTMLSDIQYQESKLHREFVVAENSTEEVDVYDKDNRQMLEASIMQGLDMDPDKLSPETATANFNKEFKVTNNGVEVLHKINKEYKGKIILANAGTGKSYASKQVDNVVDGDDLLIEAVNQLLKENPTHKQINGVSVLNDVWLSWGKGSKDKKVLENYEKLRAKVYEVQAKLAKESATKGNIVLIASSRPAILEIVDKIVYQGDTNTLIKSRASKDRENVLLMSAEEVDKKNEKFLKSIEGLEDKVVNLEANKFLSDILLANNPIKKVYESMKAGKLNVSAMAEVFAESEGHHGISSIELLVDWDAAIKGNGKLITHANLEIDAITSGMILTLLQIGSDEAIRMAEKGGIYAADRMPELVKYVHKWLGKDTTFTPGALIEAGKKHAAEIEGKMADAKKSGNKTELAKLRKELEQDSVFKDLYSTIGVGMIGEVTAYKEMLEKKEKRNASEEMQLAMLNEIGELNLKNIRSIAKSPVMVYIYGASVGSIKNKLTYSLGVDTVVKAIKKLAKLEAKTDRTAEDNAEMSQKAKFVDMFLPVESARRYVDMFGQPAEKNWLNVEISEKVIEEIGKVINATFGTAIETAFEDRLGFVNKNRDAVKAVEMLSFEAYKVRLTDAVTKALDAKYGVGKHNGESYKLSKSELVEINAELTEKGYGHTIVWKDADRVRNQSLQKTATKGGEHSMTVEVGEKSITGQVKESKAVANTGAASTIPIHAIDGDMILEVLNRELKGKLKGKYTGGNVYDAVVLGINKALLTDTADSYNTGMIEKGFNRSIMADQLEKLEEMISGLAKDGLIDQYKAAIGLRPEGDSREDYTKEMNRLKLSLSKSLDRIEDAVKLNEERIANSAKAYGSGHLYQMGSGVVDVKVANPRAKAMPAIARLRGMLNQVIEADRVVTAKEFKGRIEPGVDYVLDLNDFVKGVNGTKSKANVVQITVVEDKFNLTDKLWESMNKRDTVQILGDAEAVLEQLKNVKHGKNASYWLNRVIKEVKESGARVIESTKPTDSKPKDKARAEFDKLPAYVEGQQNMVYAGIGSRETPKDVLALMTKAATWLEGKGYKLQTGYKRKQTNGKLVEEGADKAFSDGTNNKELFGPDMANATTRSIAEEIHPNLKGMWSAVYNKWVSKVGKEKATEYADGAIGLQERNTFQVFGAKLDTAVDFVLFYAEETKDPMRPKGGTGQAVEMARRKGIPTINMANKDWRKELTRVIESTKPTEAEAKPNKSESTEVLLDLKELKTEDKIYQLLSIYSDKDAPKIGGGMIDNTIMEKYERDEDKPNAEMVKGSQDSTLKDMLPYVDGRTVNAWSKAADKWYKEQNRKPAVRKHVEDMLKAIAQIENEPKLIDELNWGNTKQEVGKMTTNEINEMALNCAK